MSSPAHPPTSPRRSRLPVRSNNATPTHQNPTTLTPTSIPMLRSPSPDGKHAIPRAHSPAKPEGVISPSFNLELPSSSPNTTPDLKATNGLLEHGKPTTPSHMLDFRSPSPSPDHDALVAQSPPKFSRPARPVRMPRNPSPELDPFMPTAQPWLQHNSPDLLAPASARHRRALMADRSQSPPKLRRPFTPPSGPREQPSHSRHSNCHSLVETSQPESRKLATTQLMPTSRSPSPNKNQQHAARLAILEAASAERSEMSTQSSSTYQPKKPTQAQPADDGLPAKRKHHLLSLPQEIQDTIFDHAYPRDDGIRRVSCQQWASREEDKHREDFEHTERPFPGVKVNEFLVSKRYFISASKAYIGNQAFNEGYHLPFGPRVEPSGFVGISWDFITHIRVRDRDCDILPRFYSLKHATVEFTELVFYTKEPEGPDAVVAAKDVKQTHLYASLMRCRVLQTFEAVSVDWHDALFRTEVWKQNVAVFQQVVNQELKERGGPQKDDLYSTISGTDHNRLYRGSRVCLDSSKLAPAILDDCSPHLPADDFTPSSTIFERSLPKHRVANAPLALRVLPGDKRSKLDAMLLSTTEHNSEQDSLQRRLRKVASSRPVDDRSIPEDIDEFKALLLLYPDAMIAWVRYSKDATCSRPLHGAPYVTERLRSAKIAFASADTKQDRDLTRTSLPPSSNEALPKSVATQADAAELATKLEMGLQETNSAKESEVESKGRHWLESMWSGEDDADPSNMSALEGYGELVLMLIMLSLYLAVGWMVTAEKYGGLLL